MLDVTIDVKTLSIWISIITAAVTFLIWIVKKRIEETLLEKFTKQMNETISKLKSEISMIGKDLILIRGDANNKKEVDNVNDKHLFANIQILQKDVEHLKTIVQSMRVDLTSVQEKVGAYMEYLRLRSEKV